MTNASSFSPPHPSSVQCATVNIASTSSAAIMTEPHAYLNGHFVGFGDLAIPVSDAGFVFGATVTDLVRTFRGRPFRLEEHIARFRKSCERCRIPLGLAVDELRVTALQLMEHNNALLPATGDL